MNYSTLKVYSPVQVGYVVAMATRTVGRRKPVNGASEAVHLYRQLSDSC